MLEAQCSALGIRLLTKCTWLACGWWGNKIHVSKAMANRLSKWTELTKKTGQCARKLSVGKPLCVYKGGGKERSILCSSQIPLVGKRKTRHSSMW